MVVESEDYKLEILEYAINQSIDRLLPKSCEDALNVILYQSNEVVWRVATEIYTKSGHKVYFIFIRDLLNLRIEPLRIKITEGERRKAELEVQRQIIKVEEERIRTEKEAEIAEKEKRKRERKEQEQKKIQEFKETHPNIHIDNYEQLFAFPEVFERIKNVIVEQLEVEEKEVKLDTLFEHLIPESYSDWQNRMKRKNIWCSSSSIYDDRDLDRVGLIMAIEDEFDIEILDEECENLLSWNVGQLVNLILQKI